MSLGAFQSSDLDSAAETIAARRQSVASLQVCPWNPRVLRVRSGRSC